MKINEYKDNINRAISPDSPYGIKLQEDPNVDFIETQLMKIGSLAHEEIEWHKIEKLTLEILTHTSKDLKILSYLIQCLQYQATPERFILSLNILADFIAEFWEGAHPFSGLKGNLARKRLLSQIIQRTTKAFDQTDLSMFDTTEKESFEIALKTLKSAYLKYELPCDELERLSNSLIRVIPQDSPSRQMAETHSQTSQTPTYTNVSIDTSDQRALKKTLLQISDFLIDLNQKSLAIQTKRLALWHAINTAPPHKADGETELAAIPADKVAEYQSLINHSLEDVTDQLWQKLEQSILLSPFWLDGHYFSYQIAKKLGYQEIANSIKQCLYDFITRLPALSNLSFKGGIPFISEATKLWLDQNTSLSKVVTSKTEALPNEDKQTKAKQLLDTLGLNEALSFLNTGLENASSLREQVYWKLALADIYLSQGLQSIADDIYLSITPLIEHTPVKEWEPDLISRLNIKLQAH